MIKGKKEQRKSVTSIRIDPDVWYQAKVEAVKARMTLGDWLTQAVKEKIKRK